MSFNEEHRGYRAVSCGVIYSIPPNRYAGIRKFSDLNGITWDIYLTANGNTIKLQSASLSVGDVPKIQMSKGEIKKVGREYRGKAVVPENYYKRMSRSSKK